MYSPATVTARQGCAAPCFASRLHDVRYRARKLRHVNCKIAQRAMSRVTASSEWRWDARDQVALLSAGGSRVG
jgi:hypothetical protein